MNTAVILVGGLGTRLRSVVGEFPKPMVDINGKPFLEYLIKYLRQQGVQRVILCVGYKHEIAQKHFRDGSEFGIKIEYAIEEELLGTAGAIKNAEHLLTHDKRFIVLNGDSFLDFDLTAFENFHIDKNSDFSFVVTKHGEKHRSGNILLSENNQVTEFREKDATTNIDETTYVNAGVYIMNHGVLDLIPKGEKFSLEYDLVPVMFDQHLNVYGSPLSSELIDIGTPESLEYFKNNYKKFFKDS